MHVLRAAAEASGIETGVIQGIREDDPEIDFGRCGVKLAEETAVRMGGDVNKKKSMDAQWGTLDNFLKVQPVSADAMASVTVVASAVGVEDYKDPGKSIEKVALYGPDEAAKEIIAKVGAVTGKDTVVINVLGGDSLIVSEVGDAVQKICQGLDIQADANILWNSLSYKEYVDGQATVVVVALNKAEDSSSLSGIERALANGEVYMDNDGNYVTVTEEDVVENFDEDWMV